MQDFESSVSPKGQITIPLEIRKQLGIKPKDKVSIRLERNVIVLAPSTSTLDAIYQSVPALPNPLTVEEMTEIAAEEHAKQFVRDELRDD